MLWTGCASLGIGNPERSADDPASKVEAARYLAERGVAAARQIAMATASQSFYEDDVRVSSSGKGKKPRRRIVRRKKADSSTSSSTESAETSDQSDGSRRKLQREREGSRSSAPSGSGDDSTVVKADVEGAVVSLDDATARTEIADTYSIEEPSASAVAIEGTFRRDEDLPSEQVAIVKPGRTIEVYAEGRSIASLTLRAKEAELPESFTGVKAVRVVRDGTLQIRGYWSEPDPDSNRRTIHVGIFKVIGDHVGTIFERVVAEQNAPDAEPKRRGFVDVLRGDRHRYLRWTPAAEDGSRIEKKAVVLHWNKWEGVFRRPVPPPTAPDPKT
jgi:hypothetical protein